ncbi:siderophore-interacting protein [Glycomyces algeriensis]|uniref:Siderophore-interacting protein n=1 Tax=Glycomyces algeriensis TaxID=256037 RepID=A0A9W6LH73_9ACTN|nr:siderophore-interacting protein [Glycomyces algeriensis]MDA1365166.1 siderophore-interacting protein [Glycomyces algeriensis]MDR7349770.1 NADPH-dependent ferric siderophore reductase [Glycomyces algeriensis]GLI42479.1 siderophore-interacting protein [Glycomyces algeriensis]
MATQTEEPTVSGAVETRAVRSYELFPVTVRALQRLSPTFMRVTFAGPTLAHFADNGYDQRFKLIFPASACGFEKMPTSERWYSELRALPEEEQCGVRTYTVRAVRQAAGEVDVDMVVHEAHTEAECGPALRWLRDAAVGDEILLLGPDARWDGPHGGLDFHAPDGAELLIAGDETAAPAIAAILEDLPVTARGKAFIEVPEAADALAVDAPEDVEVVWLARDGAVWGDKLIPAVTEAARRMDFAKTEQFDENEDEMIWEAPQEVAQCDAYVWIAAETGVVKTLRFTIRKELGLPKECGAFMGYWRNGAAWD